MTRILQGDLQIPVSGCGRAGQGRVLSFHEGESLPSSISQYKMLINAGHLLTGDVRGRAQSLAPDSSTVESKLLFQAELFNHFRPAVLKQSELQLASFFSFPMKRFWFSQIDTLSQEGFFPNIPEAEHSQMLSVYVGMQFRMLPIAYATTLEWDIPKLGSATYSVFGQIISEEREKIQKWLPNSCLRPPTTVSRSCSSRLLSVKWDFPFSLGCCQELRYYDVT